MNNPRAEEHNGHNNGNGVGTYVRATALGCAIGLGLSEGTCLAKALAAASLITISDLFSSWWEMVKITIDWSQLPAQEPGIFLRNDAVVEGQSVASVIMASRYRMNFYSPW